MGHQTSVWSRRDLLSKIVAIRLCALDVLSWIVRSGLGMGPILGEALREAAFRAATCLLPTATQGYTRA
jgi:hypothetical protein